MRSEAECGPKLCCYCLLFVYHRTDEDLWSHCAKYCRVKFREIVRTGTPRLFNSKTNYKNKVLQFKDSNEQMGIGDIDRLSNLPKVMPDTCAREENLTDLWSTSTGFYSCRRMLLLLFHFTRCHIS